MRGAESQNYAHSLSVVVPMYNEAGSVEALLEQVHEALAGFAFPWEFIVVDDGSTDQTARCLRAASSRYGPHVRVLELQRNFGQTAAMQAGIDAARGDVIATMDGDLQNDPQDIPRMVSRLLDEDLDLLAGWRRDRKDDLWRRKVPSRIANRLIGHFTGVQLHDYGCSLKVFRSDVIKGVRLYGEMHRFIPAWVGVHTNPARIKEEVVTHHPRRYGSSKYGLSRAFRVLLDLLAVYFFMRYRARPGHFFGKIGLVFGAIGALVLTYLMYVKFVVGEQIGTRPLLLGGVLMVVMSVQFITTGVLSEMMSRIYFESADVKPYVVRSASPGRESAPEDWKFPA